MVQNLHCTSPNKISWIFLDFVVLFKIVYLKLVGSPCIHFPIVIKATLCMWRSSPPSTLSAYYMQRSSRQEKWRNNLYSVNHLGHRALYAKMIILWEYPWTWWITKESSSWLKIVGGQFSTALHTGAKRYCLTKNLILNFQAKNYWDHFRASQNFSTKLMIWTLFFLQFYRVL